MTFVPGFLSDVFISYTHLDDEPDTQNLHWVSQFRDDFERSLRKRLGSDDISVFFDSSGLGAHQELAYLVDNAAASAVFLPVLSRAYIARPWTIKELTAFREASQNGRADFANINRIVPIEILPFEENTQIAALLAGPKGMGVKRTRFYFQDPETKIDYTLTSTNNDNYWKRVAELAENCSKLLRDLKARAQTGVTTDPQSVQPAPNVQPTLSVQSGIPVQLPLRGKSVLLAQATDDLYDEAQQVRNYLTQFGAQVVPESDYPVGGVDFAKAVRADLDRVDLFVQLLSGSRSRIPNDLRQSENEPPQSYSCFQYEAAKRRQKPIPILQWRRPDIKPETINHSDKQLLTGPDVRVMGLQEFLNNILARIKEEDEKQLKDEARRRKTDENQLSTNGSQHDESFFFINAYPDDFELANTIAEAFKAHNRNAFLPMPEGGLSGQKDKDIDENFINCDGLLLVFGMAPADWVRGQLRRYFKLAPRRERAPRCKKILLAPGAQLDRFAVATNFDEIDCREGALSDHIQKVVGDLCPT